jgi:RNA polymerase sigma-70 factor (ECF subfamily)
MDPPALALDDPGGVDDASLSVRAQDPGGEARLRAIRDQHFEFVWRSVRRLGVPEADADDAVQQVFIVASRRLASITEGSERAFLFGTALRVASHARRAAKRRGEVPLHDEGPQATSSVPRSPAEQGSSIGEHASSAEDLIDQRRARALLDDVLESLPMDMRAVFVLFELEEMTLAEIAALLGLPGGTVASRLRRGRELFQAEITRLKARRRRVA